MAYVLDSFVIAAINSVPLSLLGFFNYSYMTFPDRTGFVLGELIGFVLVAVYFVWFWTGGRRGTPGQRVFGIQVANAFDGQPLTTSQAIKRWAGIGTWMGIPILLPFMALGIAAFVVSIVWALLVLITTIASPTKQGVHDRLAGSALVRPAGAGNGWAVAFLVLGLIFVGLEALVFILAFTQTASTYMPTDFWDRYMHWLWPS